MDQVCAKGVLRGALLGQDDADGDLSQGDPRKLSLEDALALALSNNLGLQRSIIESEGARYDALSSWGSFDWEE